MPRDPTAMKTVTLEAVEAKTLIFKVDGLHPLRYTTDPDWTPQDEHRIHGIAWGRSYGPWWLCYVEDCFDPLKYIVRADNCSDAQDEFLEEFPEACQIQEPDLADYKDNPDRITHSPSGVHCDTEALCIRPAILVSAEFEP